MKVLEGILNKNSWLTLSEIDLVSINCLRLCSVFSTLVGVLATSLIDLLNKLPGCTTWFLYRFGSILINCDYCWKYSFFHVGVLLVCWRTIVTLKEFSECAEGFKCGLIGFRMWLMKIWHGLIPKLKSTSYLLTQYDFQLTLL